MTPDRMRLVIAVGLAVGLAAVIVALVVGNLVAAYRSTKPPKDQ